MNSDPIQELVSAKTILDNDGPVEGLPTLTEVTEAMAATETLAYDEAGKRVGAKQTIRYLRCSICDAPAGEVTLVKVQAQSVKAKTVAFLAKLPTQGYVCKGGDCAGQRNQAIMRLFKKASGALTTVRLTARGKQLVYRQEGGVVSDTKIYELTSREVQRRRKARAQQKASRKASRSK